MNSFFTILEEAAAELPDKRLFVFPETRSRGEETLTYSDLASRSRATARTLADHSVRGDRALLLFPAGSAFWEAFFGCLARGVIAVPLSIPNLNRTSEQLRRVCQDCAPSVLLTDETTAALLNRRQDRHPYFRDLPVMIPEHWRHRAESFAFQKPAGSQTAFLQYTSGSTAEPKGVQISHDNLLANSSMIRDQMSIRPRADRGVTWLPHYHDMGLVGSYLQTLFTHNTTWCLPPEEFLLRPARWLELISEHQAGICGGPDFAYRMCVEKCRDEELESIDLASWRVAYIGAERVRADTLQRFAARFSVRGFRNEAFFPCYGLGEATLLVTGGPADAAPVIRRVSAAALMTNRISPPASETDSTPLIASGQTFDGSRVVIADPDSLKPLPDEHVGEIFIAGPAVTRGYLNQSDTNSAVFHDLWIDGHRNKFLRTGDLGFLADGQLFITGRTKEIIIVRGRNLYPEDIEHYAGDAEESLVSSGIVAFAADCDGEESLVIAAELARSAIGTVSHARVASAMRHRVTEAVGVSPAEILLLRPASIPRTTSGKPKRTVLRDSYVEDTICYIYRERECRQ